ncbi:MAG: hypothetical protein V4496_05925 [Pseudomonadota bacterium]
MLKNTSRLIELYGQKLIDGSITEDELKELLEPGVFQKSQGYVDPNADVTENNHSLLDAIKDFTLNIALKLNENVLHNITTQLLELASKNCDPNCFLRNSTLEKCFFAYEMAHFPARAEQHFETNSILKEYTITERTNLMRMFSLLVNFFKEPERFFTQTAHSEYNPAHLDIEDLKEFMDHYGQVKTRKEWYYYFISTPDMPPRETKKYNVAKSALDVLEKSPNEDLITLVTMALKNNNLTLDDFLDGQTRNYLSTEFIKKLEDAQTSVCEETKEWASPRSSKSSSSNG